MKPSSPEFETKIQRFSHTGEGVGRHPSGKVAFIEGALPGETVTAFTTQEQSNWMKAEVKSVLTRSQDRVEPECRFYPKCGGCQWMHLSPSGQIKNKNELLHEILGRKLAVGAGNEVPIGSPVAADSVWGYRSKMQFPIRKTAKATSIGLYERGSHRLVPIDFCKVQSDLGNEILRIVTPLVSQCSGYDEATNTGYLKHLLVRTAGNSAHLIWVVAERSAEEELKLAMICEKIKSACPQISGISLNHNPNPGNVILGKETTLLWGESHLTEQILGLGIQYGPTSFFQINVAQAEKLFLKALELAELKPHHTIIDAYCGVGALTIKAATQVKKAIGIEESQEAIRYATLNAQTHSKQNLSWIQKSCESVTASDLPSERIDTLFFDPPRTGLKPEVIAWARKLRPQKIIYISCNPITLARDLHALIQGPTYRWKTSVAVDLFPQTSHVESVSVLEMV